MQWSWYYPLFDFCLLFTSKPCFFFHHQIWREYAREYADLWTKRRVAIACRLFTSVWRNLIYANADVTCGEFAQSSVQSILRVATECISVNLPGVNRQKLINCLVLHTDPHKIILSTLSPVKYTWSGTKRCNLLEKVKKVCGQCFPSFTASSGNVAPFTPLAAFRTSERYPRD